MVAAQGPQQPLLILLGLVAAASTGLDDVQKLILTPADQEVLDQAVEIIFELAEASAPIQAKKEARRKQAAEEAAQQQAAEQETQQQQQQQQAAAQLAAASTRPIMLIVRGGQDHFAVCGLGKTYLKTSNPTKSFHVAIGKRKTYCEDAHGNRIPCRNRDRNTSDHPNLALETCTGHHGPGIYQHEVIEYFDTPNGKKKAVKRKEAGEFPTLYQIDEAGNRTECDFNISHGLVFITLEVCRRMLHGGGDGAFKKPESLVTPEPVFPPVAPAH